MCNRGYDCIWVYLCKIWDSLGRIWGELHILRLKCPSPTLCGSGVSLGKIWGSGVSLGLVWDISGESGEHFAALPRCSSMG
jgi:hypothetical protein